MAADVRRLRLGEMLAGACAVLLFLVMFLDWYGVHIGGAVESIVKRNGGSLPSVSAWEAFSYTDLLLLLVIVVTLGWVALTLTQRAPALPIAASVIVTALAAFATLVVLLRILNQPGPNDFITVELGAYLGLLLTAGIAAGGFLAMRDEGTTLADARAQAEDLLSSRGTSQPASSPPSSASTSPPASTPGGTPIRDEPGEGGSTPPPGSSAPPASTPPKEDGPAPG